MEYELHVVEKPGRRVWYLRRVPAGKRQLLPLPSFTCERCSVQLVTPRPPIRHEAVHELGEPLAVALLIDFAFFLLAPALDKVFNEAIRPTLERFFTTLPALRARGLSADFVETLKGRSGERYAAHFIPVRGREELCLSRDAIRGGLQQLQEYVSSD